jgi:hypothetical protein
MHNWFKVVILSIVLVGCSNREIQPNLSYPLPEPVGVSKIQWHVITKDTIAKQPNNVVFIGLTWEESLEHRQFMEKLLDYIKKQKIIICKHQTCE